MDNGHILLSASVFVSLLGCDSVCVGGVCIYVCVCVCVYAYVCECKWTYVCEIECVAI